MTCRLVGAATGAALSGAAGMRALAGAVISQLFCGEEEMMMEPLDSHGDGVTDDNDHCPNTRPGAPVDANGCPADSDGDGVPDYRVECPEVPGGPVTGCPEPMVEEALFIESIHFHFDSAVIKSISKAVLDARAVPIIGDNAGIEGHTDSIGGDRHNQLLSLRRGEAVRDYLISQGIADTNLSVAGYGETNPTDGNDTTSGRANNRRAELVVRS